MSYIALYRKFRPASFDEVRGQDHIVTTLRNQIRTGRIGHAYLFVGTRGTGKTSVAKILARSVNCLDPRDGSPCGECEVCKAMDSGAALNVVELDAAANNGVEGVRQIIDEIGYSPTIGRYRVYIIDEVHMFSTAAFNALLKTLEEPPEYVIFILATTEIQTIPVTILSRCQRYDFHRISLEEIRDRLREVAVAENIAVTEDALTHIARAADGALRDGLSLLDQCAAFHYGEELTRDMVLDVLGAVEVEVYGELMDAVSSGDVAAALDCVSKAVADGRDLVQYVGDLIWYLRNLMLIKAAGDDASRLTDLSTENQALLEKKAEGMDLEILLRDIRIFSELSSQIRYSMQKRILLETTIIRLMRPQTEEDRADLGARIRMLEDRSDENDRQIERALKEIKSGNWQPAPGAGGTGVPSAADDPARRDRAETLAAALPEDVKEVIERHREVLSRLDPAAKSIFQTCRFMVNEQEPDVLLVDVTDEIRFDVGDPEVNEKRIALLKDAIAAVISKDVKVRLVAGTSREEVLENNISEDELLALIHMETDVEEPDAADAAGGSAG